MAQRTHERVAADRFMDLQKQAPIEEDFLRADMQRRLAAVVSEQAAARSKERRGRKAAVKRSDDGEDPAEPELSDEQKDARGQLCYKMLENLTIMPGHDENGELKADRLVNWVEQARGGRRGEIGCWRQAHRPVAFPSSRRGR